MTYTAKTWAADTALPYTDLAHIEEQYQDILDYLTAHDHDTRYYPKALSDSYFWDTSIDGAGSGLDADKLGGTESAAIVGGVDIGIGGYWYGTLSDFTAGYLNVDATWHICNGSDGTVDLRDVLILGAGGGFSVGASGGNASFTPAGSATIDEHVLTAAETMHTHALVDYYAACCTRGTASVTYSTFYPATTATATERSTDAIGGGLGHSHTATFVGESISLLPPYKTLIPIQKIAAA